MNNLSVPYLNKIQSFAHFIQSDAEVNEEIWYPITSVRIPQNENAEKINRQRSAWHFLTLGIPFLFEALSLFFSGITHRETMDVSLRVRFKYERLPLNKMVDFLKFQEFNETTSKPLNKAATDKAIQKMLRLINRIEAAKMNGSDQEVLDCQYQLNAVGNMLKKNSVRNTRKDFNEADWKVVDQIDFELAYEYFESLTDLFNSDWMTFSYLQKELSKDLGIDYQESVIAESLALSLAYIEDLEGKTLVLPVWDQTTVQYVSKPFTIKLMTLGDALPCYILENPDPCINPWFIVRGTQPYISVSPNNKEYRSGGLESLLADSLDPECISRNVINKALVSRPIVSQNGFYVQKESLSDVFRNWKQQGKRVNFSGHSLGGTIVNALAVEFYDQIKTAYAFSGAGVSRETADKWDILNQTYPSLSLESKLINFDYEGDIVPSGGRRLIGTHLAIESLVHIGPNGIYDCHVRSHLNHDFKIQKIDVNKETHKWARVFCEYLRIITGKCFRLLLWVFSNKYLPEWWKNRKVYREKADWERSLRGATSHLCVPSQQLFQPI